MTMRLPSREILQCYFPAAANVQVSILGQGNINDTFLATTAQKSIVLQRINDQVFPNPQLLIDNLQHLSRHMSSLPATSGQHWQDVVLVPARDGSLSVFDTNNKLWRALSYVEDTISLSRAANAFQAEQTGWALGYFHRRLSTLESGKLQQPLPGFHDISGYLKQFDQLQPMANNQNSAEARFCLQTITAERSTALTLENALSRGKIRRTVTHGDPKIGNILFDRESGRAVSIIDLDTVGPGLYQHDIGDCLRSVCNTAGEEGEEEEIRFDLDICRSTLQGYFQEADTLLTPTHRQYIYDGLKSITFELGLRFFTDYLQGGTYFKCKTPEETLAKAVVQFSLLQDIAAKEIPIRELSLLTDRKRLSR